MRNQKSNAKGFTLLEMLVATVVGAMVVAGCVVLFIGGLRLSLGMQATSSAVSNGSTGIDRLRLTLTEATAYALPSDDDPFPKWDNSLLGNTKQYLSSSKDQTLNTAIYLSYPSPRAVLLRADNTKNLSTTISVRSTVSNGALLYRGDPSGNVNPTSGTVLWMWTYLNGQASSKVSLCRKLSTSADAVSFRRGNASGTVLRYRLVQVEKDSYNNARSLLGTSSASLLDASDFALTLLNNTGGAVPTTALPSNGATHP